MSIINRRLNDMDLVTAIREWSNVQASIDELNRQRRDVYSSKETVKEMYFLAIGIPALCEEIIRLRQYVPADKRYP